jgi:hypothetical protein
METISTYKLCCVSCACEEVYYYYYYYYYYLLLLMFACLIVPVRKGSMLDNTEKTHIHQTSYEKEKIFFTSCDGVLIVFLLWPYFLYYGHLSRRSLYTTLHYTHPIPSHPILLHPQQYLIKRLSQHSNSCRLPSYLLVHFLLTHNMD